MSFWSSSLFGQRPPARANIRLAVIGLTGAGKTSYLAALLHGGLFVRGVRAGVSWTPEADDRATSTYLLRAWESITDGRPVAGTAFDEVPASINITLRRRAVIRGVEHLTHSIHLHVLDSAGAFTVDGASRMGEVWQDVAKRIAEAHVILVAIDAMNVFHRGDHAGQRQVTKLFDVLEHASTEASAAADPAAVPLDRKSVALCFCKCDAQTLVDIDGIDDDSDAKRLASKLLPQEQQHKLEARFGRVGYFGVSILRDQWRWSRDGACVKIGDDAVAPVGVFEPFEWITSEQSTVVR